MTKVSFDNAKLTLVVTAIIASSSADETSIEFECDRALSLALNPDWNFWDTDERVHRIGACIREKCGVMFDGVPAEPWGQPMW